MEEVLSEATPGEQVFVPVPLCALIEESSPDFSIYLKQGERANHFVLYREAGGYISRDHLASLRTNGVRTVFALTQDREKQLRYFTPKLEYLVKNRDISEEIKADLIYGLGRITVRDVLENPVKSNVENCRTLAVELVRFIIREKNAFRVLFKLMSYDYQIQTHSVNVSIFLTALANNMKLCDREVLSYICAGALLHDVGKVRIAKEILDKKGPLTAEEFELVKKHPQFGLDIVQEVTDLPDVSLNIVHNHHEKCDGSGYPKGISVRDIDIYARIACIVDVFDALTTKRCYGDASHAFSAFGTMQSEMRRQIDTELLKEFILLVGKASS